MPKEVRNSKLGVWSTFWVSIIFVVITVFGPVVVEKWNSGDSLANYSKDPYMETTGQKSDVENFDGAIDNSNHINVENHQLNQTLINSGNGNQLEEEAGNVSSFNVDTRGNNSGPIIHGDITSIENNYTIDKNEN